MSFSHPSIRPHERPRTPLTINYFTVYVNTNMPGYDSAVRNAVFKMRSKSTDWADDARTAMDLGWTWGYEWTDERWIVEILRADILSGVYMIRIVTDRAHSWMILARYLKNMINQRGLYLGRTWRRQYVRRISAQPPDVWGMEAIGAFDPTTIRKIWKRSRRGPN